MGQATLEVGPLDTLAVARYTYCPSCGQPGRPQPLGKLSVFLENTSSPGFQRGSNEISKESQGAFVHSPTLWSSEFSVQEPSPESRPKGLGPQPEGWRCPLHEQRHKELKAASPSHADPCRIHHELGGHPCTLAATGAPYTQVSAQPFLLEAVGKDKAFTSCPTCLSGNQGT